MHLLTLGVNHKSASIGLREKLSVSPDTALANMQQVMRSPQVNAMVLVATCNRTEIYLEADSLQPVLRCIKREANLNLQDLRQSTYLHIDREAVQHLMHVACGLDSMVIGEVEILGQLKTAYQVALEQNTVNKNLSRLFQHAFSVAKKVRTQTSIGLNPVSVAYLAVRLAERIFTKLSNKTALIVGAGDTAKLVIKHLQSAGIDRFYLANRTIQNAQALISELGLQSGVELLDLTDIPRYLMHADIVVTATASPLPIIGKGMVEQAIRARKHKPMFMIDLAVPRNIEPQVRGLAEVYLYGIDDLLAIAAEHKRFRLSAVEQAEHIILDEVDKFMAWVESQQAFSTISAFRKNCMRVRDQALMEALRQLQIGKEPIEVMHRLAYVLSNRLMHDPTVKMREAATNGNKDLLETARVLFNLIETDQELCPKENNYERIDT